MATISRTEILKGNVAALNRIDDVEATDTPTFAGVILTSEAITATSDGLTTGLVTSGVNNITVTSASANNIVTLPATTGIVGQSIRGYVGANGCELRTPASSGATINTVDCDGTNEAAIPATTMFEVTAVAADTWILRAWTELGAVITAIIPDSA